MIVKKPTETFLEFSRNIRGFKILNKGHEVSKFIPYWVGLTSRDLISRQSNNYKLTKR